MIKNIVMNKYKYTRTAYRKFQLKWLISIFNNSKEAKITIYECFTNFMPCIAPIQLKVWQKRTSEHMSPKDRLCLKAAAVKKPTPKVCTKKYNEWPTRRSRRICSQTAFQRSWYFFRSKFAFLSTMIFSGSTTLSVSCSLRLKTIRNMQNSAKIKR